MSDEATIIPAKTYLAGGIEYRYPLAGDPKPPPNAKVQLLTIGGTCVSGNWVQDSVFLGWAPLPSRNADKEKKVKEALYRLYKLKV